MSEIRCSGCGADLGFGTQQLFLINGSLALKCPNCEYVVKLLVHSPYTNPKQRVLKLAPEIYDDSVGVV